MVRRVGVLGAALLIAASCSSGSPKPAATVTVTASSSPTTDDTATIRQFVSVVEIMKAKIGRWHDGLETCPATSREDRIACGVFANQSSFVALDAYTDMNQLGPPPEHIALLVQETLSAAKTVLDALPTEPGVRCNFTPSDQCDR